MTLTKSACRRLLLRSSRVWLRCLATWLLKTVPRMGPTSPKSCSPPVMNDRSPFTFPVSAVRARRPNLTNRPQVRVLLIGSSRVCRRPLTSVNEVDLVLATPLMTVGTPLYRSSPMVSNCCLLVTTLHLFG